MPETELSSPDSKTIRSFFDAIPAHYDFLNSFLSLSLDNVWRKALIRLSVEGWEDSLLDIGAGTGTSLEAFCKAKRFNPAVGADFSGGMLQVAKEKVNGAHLVQADLHTLPFQSESFDLVSSSFVLRSVKNMDQFLSEVRRVLTQRGKFAFLDLTRPKNWVFWHLLYRPYLNCYLPLVGKLISKHKSAYQFLSQSIQTFVEPIDLKRKMEAAGFSSVEIKPLSFGTATGVMGRK